MGHPTVCFFFVSENGKFSPSKGETHRNYDQPLDFGVLNFQTNQWMIEIKEMSHEQGATNCKDGQVWIKTGYRGILNQHIDVSLIVLFHHLCWVSHSLQLLSKCLRRLQSTSLPGSGFVPRPGSWKTSNPLRAPGKLRSKCLQSWHSPKYLWDCCKTSPLEKNEFRSMTYPYTWRWEPMLYYQRFSCHHKLSWRFITFVATKTACQLQMWGRKLDSQL